MKNSNWSSMESAGDQSSYVGELLRHIDDRVGQVLGMVVKPQYARAFCDNFVEHVSAAYVSSVVQCRPISEVGAEQMLLDKYVMTKSLENLLSHHPGSRPAGSPLGAAYAPSAGLVKRVNQSMGRVDPLLKTLQVRPSPPEGLVQAYLIHIADRSDTNFKKVLELKGVRKQDQAVLVELFAIHRDGPSDAGRRLVDSSSLLTPLMAPGASMGSNGAIMGGASALTTATLGAGGAGNGGGGGAAGTANGTGAGPRGFDAAMLGERLLSAAREMGDKAAIGGAGDKASINENLKNIGKFFRSDFGGLGARFGKRDVSGGGPE
jgi:hypothetical protein